MIRDAMFVAIFEMRRHPVRTLLTISGVAIAIATVVGVGSMLGSVQRLVSTLLTEAGGLQLVTVVFKEQKQIQGRAAPSRRPNPLSTVDSAATRDLLADKVAGASLRININGVLSNGENAQQIVVAAVEPEYFGIFNRRLIAGRFLTENDIRDAALAAVIGEHTAKLFLGSGVTTGRELRLNNIRMTVVGVVADTGFGEGNRFELIMPVTAARFRFASPPGRGPAKFLHIRIRDGVDLGEFKRQIMASLLARHPGYTVNDFEVATAEENVAQAQQGMLLIGLVFLLVCGLCLLTGGVGIMNVLLSSVAERTREIGLRSAVGARRKDLLLQFLLESLSFTTLGALLGIGAGYAFGFTLSVLVNKFMKLGGDTAFHLRPSLHPAILIAAVLTSSFIGVVFGLYPALKASRVSPVEALHVE